MLLQNINGDLQHYSLCFLSNGLNHDVEMMYEIQKQTICFLKNILGSITKVEYYTNGCASHYKNCKNFVNLCKHEEDCDVCAEWSFFVTIHGKSAWDGIRDRIKKINSFRKPQKTSHESDTKFERSVKNTVKIPFQKFTSEKLINKYWKNLQTGSNKDLCMLPQ